MIRYPAQIIGVSINRDKACRPISNDEIEYYPIGEPYIKYKIKYFTDPPTTVDLLESSCRGINITPEEIYENKNPIYGFVEINEQGYIQFTANKESIMTNEYDAQIVEIIMTPGLPSLCKLEEDKNSAVVCKVLVNTLFFGNRIVSLDLGKCMGVNEEMLAEHFTKQKPITGILQVNSDEDVAFIPNKE